LCAAGDYEAKTVCLKYNFQSDRVGKVITDASSPFNLQLRARVYTVGSIDPLQKFFWRDFDGYIAAVPSADV